jgi:hypothetical protein
MSEQQSEQVAKQVGEEQATVGMMEGEEKEGRVKVELLASTKVIAR